MPSIGVRPGKKTGGGTRGGDPPQFCSPILAVPAELRAVRSASPGPAAPGRRGHGSPGPDGAYATLPPGSVRRDKGSPDPRGRERRAAAPAPDGGRRSAPPTDGRQPYAPTAARREPDRWRREPPPPSLPAPGPTCGGGCGSRRGGSGCSGGGASRSAAAGAAPRRAALPFFVSGKLRALTQAVTGAGPARSRARPASCPPPGGALTQGRRRRLPAPPAGGAAREGPGGRRGGLGPERGRRRGEGLPANTA